MSAINHVQDTLSKYQTCEYFIFGPLIVSPIKAVVSLIQIVAGAVFISYNVLRDNLNGRVFSNETKAAYEFTDKGVLALMYSITNLITLGVFGLFFEHLNGSLRRSCNEVKAWLPPKPIED